MDIENASSSHYLAHSSFINNELPSVCDEMEIGACILWDMKNGIIHSRMKSNSRRVKKIPKSKSTRVKKISKSKSTRVKKISRTPTSNHIIQIFECRACHQTFTSQKSIRQHSKGCRLTQYRTSQRDFTNHKSYLKIKLKCVY